MRSVRIRSKLLDPVCRMNFSISYICILFFFLYSKMTLVLYEVPDKRLLLFILGIAFIMVENKIT